MIAFETGLRSYVKNKSKSIDPPQAGTNGLGTKSRPEFSGLPMIDRGEYPSYTVTQKELEKLKKTYPVYNNDRIVIPLKHQAGKVKILAL